MAECVYTAERQDSPESKFTRMNPQAGRNKEYEPPTPRPGKAINLSSHCTGDNSRAWGPNPGNSTKFVQNH